MPDAVLGNSAVNVVREGKEERRGKKRKRKTNSEAWSQRRKQVQRVLVGWGGTTQHRVLRFLPILLASLSEQAKNHFHTGWRV